MLEEIKLNIFKTHKPDEKIGLFLTLLDEKNTILTSSGVMETDKPLQELITILYNGIVQKHPSCKHIVAEVPSTLTLQKDAEQLLNLSVTEYGICLVSPETQKSGVLLP